MDNFRGNNKIGNANNGKCETNNNSIITKEENKNNSIDNNDIIENSKNIIYKKYSNKNVNEDLNVKESVQVNNINSSLTKESKIIDNKNSKINNIQIIPNNNNDEQCINKKYSVNNKNSLIDCSKIINIDSDKEKKIKIKKNIKIPPIGIQNIGKNKININKLMMPKPEIALKDIIIYSNNRVDTKRIIRNYRYKRK
ncbi:hypothetical protein LY90DRAFT_506243 [Neocallimastix californiae]|uniref:Uncharacterized protein n=1 Tax=Neocallimastix californiae TaxID=1754190 RepID=A0A1Y2DHL3_9FUNG|nr:hypothetical protein LY90DRAFT_506243 [Neocallimastix californiae]|eukprot:ORY58255.1 hypothetical protein LY90DRAFT_506243 [Neocallimastix californiae]